VKRCAAEFGLTGRWGFQYANTCSKPRLDGFGGGAHVLDLATGETVDWIYTDGWLAQTISGEEDRYEHPPMPGAISRPCCAPRATATSPSWNASTRDRQPALRHLRRGAG
jgi:hypothetical protein